jgi:CelD/BcsL family acetyltransferase involved in cellulose biosynthesis
VAGRVLSGQAPPETSGALTVDVAAGDRALAALGAEWDALLHRQPLPSPTLGSRWLWSMAVPEGALVVSVRRGGTLAGGGAFRIRRAGPIRLATWLGGARLPDVLAAPHVEEAAARVLEAALEQSHALWLPHTPVGGAAWRALEAVAPWRRAALVHPCGWVVDLPPPRLDHARRKAAYARRRAARRGAEIAVSVWRDPDDVGPAFERLVDLYRNQWRGREAEGSRRSDVVTRADRYRELLPALAVAGRVRIVEVLEDGRVASTKLGLLAGRGALFHTTATAPGGSLRGPGHQAMLAWVEAATAAGAEVMYLGRGAGEPEGPKARLGPSRLDFANVLVAASARRQRRLDALRGLAAPLGRLRGRAAYERISE